MNEEKMKPYTLEWWMYRFEHCKTLEEYFFDINKTDQWGRHQEISDFIKKRIINKYGEKS
jgi:glucose-6-phosphate isomerase